MMAIKNKHHGSNSGIQKPNPDPVCMPKMKPFFDNMGIYFGQIARRRQPSANCDMLTRP